MSFFKKISFVSVALILLSACTDYVAEIDEQIEELEAKQSGTSSNIEAVVSHEDLPSFCDEEGSTIYVEDEGVDYVCTEGTWLSPISSSSSFAKSSSSEKLTNGTMTDLRDGQTYKTVKIGSQTWMAENLNYKTDRSYCYYDANYYCSQNGRLYVWSAAQVACPSGWHLPSKSEIEKLFSAVGGQYIAGNMLKSTSKWYNNDNGTNAYGFSVYPYGLRDVLGNYYDEEQKSFFWSSTEYDDTFACYMYFKYNFDQVELDCGDSEDGLHSKNQALSVRCLKD